MSGRFVRSSKYRALPPLRPTGHSAADTRQLQDTSLAEERERYHSTGDSLADSQWC